MESGTKLTCFVLLFWLLNLSSLAVAQELDPSDDVDVRLLSSHEAISAEQTQEAEAVKDEQPLRAEAEQLQPEEAKQSVDAVQTADSDRVLHNQDQFEPVFVKNSEESVTLESRTDELSRSSDERTTTESTLRFQDRRENTQSSINRASRESSEQNTAKTASPLTASNTNADPRKSNSIEQGTSDERRRLPEADVELRNDHVSGTASAADRRSSSEEQLSSSTSTSSFSTRSTLRTIHQRKESSESVKENHNSTIIGSRELNETDSFRNDVSVSKNKFSDRESGNNDNAESTTEVLEVLEIPTTRAPRPIPTACGSDLMIVLDNSESVIEQWIVTRELAVKMIDTIDLDASNNVALVVYNYASSLLFSFSKPSDKEEILETIKNLSPLGGETNTWDALTTAQEEFKSFGRPNVKRLMMLITDGNSQNSLENLRNRVRSLDDMGIDIYAASPSINPGLLEFEAYSGGHEDRIFLSWNLTDVIPIIAGVIQEAQCTSVPKAAVVKPTADQESQKQLLVSLSPFFTVHNATQGDSSESRNEITQASQLAIPSSSTEAIDALNPNLSTRSGSLTFSKFSSSAAVNVVSKASSASRLITPTSSRSSSLPSTHSTTSSTLLSSKLSPVASSTFASNTSGNITEQNTTQGVHLKTTNVTPLSTSKATSFNKILNSSSFSEPVFDLTQNRSFSIEDPNNTAAVIGSIESSFVASRIVSQQPFAHISSHTIAPSSGSLAVTAFPLPSSSSTRNISSNFSAFGETKSSISPQQSTTKVFHFPPEIAILNTNRSTSLILGHALLPPAINTTHASANLNLSSVLEKNDSISNFSGNNSLKNTATIVSSLSLADNKSLAVAAVIKETKQQLSTGKDVSGEDLVELPFGSATLPLQACAADFLFVVDASGSSQHDFDSEMNYVTEIVQRLSVGPTTHRVAVISYSTPELQKLVITFDQFQGHKQRLLKDRRRLKQNMELPEVPFYTGSPATGKALRMALRTLDFRRPEVQTIVVVVSYGISSDDPAELAREIRNLSNTTLYAVAAEQANREGLLAIAGNESHVFMGENGADNFKKELDNIIACQEPKTTKPSLNQTSSLISSSLPATPTGLAGFLPSSTTTATVTESAGLAAETSSISSSSTPTTTTSTTTTTVLTSLPAIAGCVSDVLFVFDASGSVADGFAEEVKIAHEIVDRLVVSAHNTRIGAVKYSSSERTFVTFSLGSKLSKDEVTEKLDAMQFLGGITHTGSALELAVEELTNDGRQDVPHIVVVFTDGFSTASDNIRRIAEVFEAAAKLRKVSTVFAVGSFAQRVNAEQLRIIANGNVEDNTRAYSDKNDVGRFLGDISQLFKSCKEEQQRLS